MNIFVGILNFKVEEDDLETSLKSMEQLVPLKLSLTNSVEEVKVLGLLKWTTRKGANKAIEELNGATLENRNMVVNEAKPRNNNNNNRRQY
jgi:RNA recognition motif-containing protein